MAHAAKAPPPPKYARPIANSWECGRLPGFNVPLVDVSGTTMQLQLVVVFFITQALHHCAFKHIGLPRLVSQMMAGLVISPGAFYLKKGGLYEKILNEVIFPELSTTVWKTMAWLGGSLSCFLLAAQIDYGIITKTGKKAYVIGILGFLLPFFVNTAVISQIKVKPIISDGGKTVHDDIIVTSSMTASAHFPVVACLLSDLNLLNSELGRLAMSATLIGEIGSLTLILIGKYIDNFSWSDLRLLVGPIMVIIVAFFVIRPIMKKMIQLTPKDRPIKTTFVALVFLFGIVAGLVVNYTSDKYVLIGLFTIGAVIPSGPPLASAFVDVFDPFVHGILQPFFITVTVRRANLFGINFLDEAIRQRMTVVILPNVIKLLLCLASAVALKMPIGDGLVLGLLLGAKGFIDLSIYGSNVTSKMITEASYSLLVFWTLVVATIVPLLIKILYNPNRKYGGYQRRDIMHLKQSNELRILPCIYRTDNTIAITNLLDICNPTKYNPIVAYVLHLVNLVGRSRATFISHDLQKKKSTSHRSHSEDIVVAFERYQSNYDQCYQGGLTTHLYTSVTLNKAMHEEICTLALNTFTSLIILPFHRKFGIDGSIESEYSDQRSLNISVLDRAPSSVAVHVNRGLARKAPNGSFNQERSQSSMSSSSATRISHETADIEPEFAVAVVFIGGNDDREALELAKWMARGIRVRIHLVRLLAAAGGEELDRGNEDGQGGEIDTMMIQEIRTKNVYKEKFSNEDVTVKDGGETAAIMKAMADDFDLMIVGRSFGSECRQTAGLKEWSEFPELGVIGDLLASPDLRCRTSVLVVQRQKQGGSDGLLHIRKKAHIF